MEQIGFGDRAQFTVGWEGWSEMDIEYVCLSDGCLDLQFPGCKPSSFGWREELRGENGILGEKGHASCAACMVKTDPFVLFSESFGECLFPAWCGFLEGDYIGFGLEDTSVTEGGVSAVIDIKSKDADGGFLCAWYRWFGWFFVGRQTPSCRIGGTCLGLRGGLASQARCAENPGDKAYCELFGVTCHHLGAPFLLPTAT